MHFIQVSWPGGICGHFLCRLVIKCTDSTSLVTSGIVFEPCRTQEDSTETISVNKLLDHSR